MWSYFQTYVIYGPSTGSCTPIILARIRSTGDVFSYWNSVRTIRRGDKVSGLVDCQSDEMFVIVCAQVESVLERSAIRVLSAHEKKYKKRTNVVIRLDCVHIKCPP